MKTEAVIVLLRLQFAAAARGCFEEKPDEAITNLAVKMLKHEEKVYAANENLEVVTKMSEENASWENERLGSKRLKKKRWKGLTEDVDSGCSTEVVTICRAEELV